MQLVFHEAAEGVGQRYAVHQQDRENREKVQQRDQLARANATRTENEAQRGERLRQSNAISAELADSRSTAALIAGIEKLPPAT